MRKFKPLIVEQLIFAVLFVGFYFAFQNSAMSLPKAIKICIAFEIAVFCSYQVCWYRLRVCRVTAITRLTDGFFFLVLMAIFAITLKCLVYFGFEPLSQTGMVWLSSRYALVMLLVHILGISIMAPDTRSLLQPFDQEDDDDEDDSI